MSAATRHLKSRRDGVSRRDATPRRGVPPRRGDGPTPAPRHELEAAVSESGDDIVDRWTDLSQPGALAGIGLFARHSKLPVPAIKDALSGQEAYTRHVPMRHRYRRGRMFVSNHSDEFQMDLAEMQTVKDSNDGYAYFLLAIDSFSKYMYIVPLKTKTGEETAEAIETVFQKARSRGDEFHVPYVCRTDNGKEFLNGHVRALFERHDVKHVTSSDYGSKMAIAERAIRTIKTKIYRYFSLKNTYNWISVIDDLVHSYNSSWNTSIKTSPSSVGDQNTSQIFDNLYGKTSRLGEAVFASDEKQKFVVGDFVRISLEKAAVGSKGYLPHFSREIFIVQKCIPRSPPVYILKDLLGEELKGAFYEPELVLVKKFDIDTAEYPVDKILARRTRDKRREVLVSFAGYPEKFNLWLPESEVTVNEQASAEQAAADRRIELRKRGAKKR